jgi:hypothetical protein
MRGESVESHARALARLAWPGRGGAKDAGARHAREWSAEIRTLILTDRYKISTDCEIFVGG